MDWSICHKTVNNLRLVKKPSKKTHFIGLFCAILQHA